LQSVEEALTVHAATIEDWVAPRQAWELTLREGTEFERANNVEAGIAKLVCLTANGLDVELFHILTFT
jgi:hypothetical protein